MSPLAARCSPGFDALVAAYSPDMAERHEGTVFGLWSDLSLAYFNPAWLSFGAANHAPAALLTAACLGTPVVELTAEPLREFYRDFYGFGLKMQRRTRRPLQHIYECSSATEFRQFNMTLYPLGAARGLLVVNTLVTAEAHDAARRPPHEPDVGAYSDEDGMIRQCAHCRKIRRGVAGARWDWVPAWVEQPPRETSHTLCTFCMDYFYPDN